MSALPIANAGAAGTLEAGTGAGVTGKGAGASRASAAPGTSTKKAGDKPDKRPKDQGFEKLLAQVASLPPIAVPLTAPHEVSREQGREHPVPTDAGKDAVRTAAVHAASDHPGTAAHPAARRSSDARPEQPPHVAAATSGGAAASDAAATSDAAAARQPSAHGHASRSARTAPVELAGHRGTVTPPEAARGSASRPTDPIVSPAQAAAPSSDVVSPPTSPQAPLPASPAAPAPAPADTPSAQGTHPLPGVSGQLVQVLSAPRPAGQGSFSVSVALRPPNLGTVQATVTAGKSHVTVQLVPSTPEGADALRIALPDLKTALSSNGQQVQVVLGESSAPPPGSSFSFAPGQGGSSGYPPATGRQVPTASAPPQPAPAPPAPEQRTPASVHDAHLVDIRI